MKELTARGVKVSCLFLSLDHVDAVRIYTAGAARGTETLKEIFRLLR